MFKNSFFHQSELQKEKAERIISDALLKADDGELFLEQSFSENFIFEDSKLKDLNYTTSKGFGLRGIKDEFVAYAHCSDITEENLTSAAKIVTNGMKSQRAGTVPVLGKYAPHPLYTGENLLSGKKLEEKISLLGIIDRYIRDQEPLIRQVVLNLIGNWQIVEIMRADGSYYTDIRPLVRLNISLIIQDDQGRIERGGKGFGGRYAYDVLFNPKNWQYYANEALRQARLNLKAMPAPAGEMPVILGSGWCGVLLHEAIGHGLEGDFNRKKTSAFTDKIGHKIAAEEITVVDDPTLSERRGSLAIDDEGTQPQKTVLVENGRLVNYMQDRQNAKLMNMRSTGNARRQSYAHPPMPRMTNTYMLAGQSTREEMILNTKKGILAIDFGGGQVDITSGNFVFSATEAYLIEDGKVTVPLKGVTLIGHGPTALTKITMVGDDLQLDTGIGTCGKDGQSVPVGVGQPSLLIHSMTVGGTNL